VASKLFSAAKALLAIFYYALCVTLSGYLALLVRFDNSLTESQSGI